MKKIIVCLTPLLLVACADNISLYHPEHGRVNSDNPHLDADIQACTKNIKIREYEDTDTWNEDFTQCLKGKGWKS